MQRDVATSQRYMLLYTRHKKMCVIIVFKCFLLVII
jgi:hypothetical protein